MTVRSEIIDGEATADLRAPFPWFGGKSRAAALCWSRFGQVKNYVEPFAGSLATLLGRPADCWASEAGPGTETVNDLDCYLANFWRALASDPDGVARWATGPVNEADLHARHRWLVEQAEFREQMKSDPEYTDAKIAGWWVWGQCCWIGTGWCVAAQRAALVDGPASKAPPRVPQGRQGPPRQLPHLGDAWMGLHRKLPHLGDAGRGEAIRAYLRGLAARLHGVRVACGDWRRVLGPSVTWRHGTTAILLDPPYAEGEMGYSAGGGESLSAQVAAWAKDNGDHPKLRIALCGLAGEHKMPKGWVCVPWTARGGYGSQRTGGVNDNRRRERIWFSPHCLRAARAPRSSAVTPQKLAAPQPHQEAR